MSSSGESPREGRLPAVCDGGRAEAWTRRQRWRRERHIVSALTRHGVGVTLSRVGLPGLLPFQWGILGHGRREEPYSGPEHLRLAFEDLGPTFIKLAQILSTRGDLIGVDYALELARLQSGVPPVPFDDVASVLDRELGCSHGEVFSEIDPTPIGSGSIGQVHRATLRSGENVVVKVQKPGVADEVVLDLAILRSWLVRHTVRRRSSITVDVEGFFDEFAFTLLNELDYRNEAENAARLREIHAGDPTILIPAVHWAQSTKMVFVMEEVAGTEVRDQSITRDMRTLDRHRLASAALHAAFVEILQHGFFHADPHPGNFLITPDGRLGLLDFGMVGTLSESQRRHFLGFVRSIGEKDSGGILDAWWRMGVTEPEAERPGLMRDLDRLFHRVGTKSVEDIAASDMAGELMRIAHRHRLQLPATLALLFKVLAMLESAAVLIDPDFLFFEALEPEIVELTRKETSSAAVRRRVRDNALDMANLADGLPQRADRLLQRIETGDVEFTPRQEGLERALEQLVQAARRLTAVVAVGSLLIAFGIYVLAAETAETGSNRLDTFEIFLSVAVGLLVLFVALGVRARRR